MMRVAGPLLLAVSLLAGPVSAEPRARDNHLVSAAVLSAQQAGDSCGGRGILDTAVPNGPFIEACRFHDACYRSGALDQGQCDADFLHDMRSACDADFPVPAKAGQNAACQVAAATYYKAVNSRFGALLYPRGVTDGQIGAVAQRLTGGLNGGPSHLEACAEVTNTANRKLRFYVTLHDARGKWVATAPAMKSAALQPGETRQICAGTRLSWFRSADNIGPAYALTLKADDPATINPLGDLVSLDRMDCQIATGACRRVAP